MPSPPVQRVKTSEKSTSVQRGRVSPPPRGAKIKDGFHEGGANQLPAAPLLTKRMLSDKRGRGGEGGGCRSGAHP